MLSVFEVAYLGNMQLGWLALRAVLLVPVGEILAGCMLRMFLKSCVERL